MDASSVLHVVQSDWVRGAAEVVTLCSVLHSLLPPWDWKPDFIETGLQDFPSSQKAFYSIFHNRYYKLLIYVVGYVALNMRSTTWRSISIQNPRGLNTPGAPSTSLPSSDTKVADVTNSGTPGNPVGPGSPVQ